MPLFLQRLIIPDEQSCKLKFVVGIAVDVADVVAIDIFAVVCDVFKFTLAVSVVVLGSLVVVFGVVVVFIPKTLVSVLLWFAVDCITVVGTSVVVATGVVIADVVAIDIFAPVVVDVFTFTVAVSVAVEGVFPSVAVLTTIVEFLVKLELLMVV